MEILRELAMLACVIGFVVTGYVFKATIQADRQKNAVKLILADIQEHDRFDWGNMDLQDKEHFMFKWGEIIKRGDKGYYRWLDRKLGKKAIRIGENNE